MALDKTKKRRNALIITGSVVVILILAGIAIYISINNKLNKIPRDNSEDVNIVQNPGTEVVSSGYHNIVLFGLDTRDNSLKRGNSDTIIIASINNVTKDVKLVSIYRDTYTNIISDGYDKINAAYMNGGYSLAISTINKSFDLDITEYMTVNFKAVCELIDKLGGITLDIQPDEIHYLNGYVNELNVINGTNVAHLTNTGTQLVNGTQAVAYSRIRYTEGGDYVRTERQRTVIGKVFDKVKASNLSTINSLMDDIFPQTQTNLTNTEIMSLLKDIFSYKIVDQTGFPFEKDSHTYDKISYVFPINLAQNVTELHQFLFGKTDYVPTQTVKDYSAYIEGIRTK